jgi:hypothetical protein
MDEAAAVLRDGAGGAYIAGRVYGGSNPWNVNDVFVARIDGAGDELWFRQFGTLAQEILTGLAPDGAGGLYACGRTRGSLTGQNPSSSYDAFLTRYDNAGDRLWLRQFGTTDHDAAEAVAADGAGGVYIAGSMSGTLGGTPQGGSSDAYLARYDSTGDRLWIRQFGSTGQDGAGVLASGGAGSVYVVWGQGGTAGGVLLARYDSAGDRLWTRPLAFGVDSASADGSGGVYLAGLTHGSVGGPQQGAGDGVLARYDASGELLWVRQAGGADAERFLAVSQAGAGGAYVAGRMSDPPGGPWPGHNHALWGRYDADGELLWIQRFGEGADTAMCIDADGENGAYLGGLTSRSFGPAYAGGLDAFLIRFPADCYPNCDSSSAQPGLNVADFTCFLGRFAAADLWANCDRSTVSPVLNAADFTCFLQRYAAGCP